VRVTVTDIVMRSVQDSLHLARAVMNV